MHSCCPQNLQGLGEKFTVSLGFHVHNHCIDGKGYTVDDEFPHYGKFEGVPYLLSFFTSSSTATLGRDFVHRADLPAWAFRLCSDLVMAHSEAESW
jgi:hypothetical protein